MNHNQTPSLYLQITAGRNGTRIYFCEGRCYLVDGEIDYRLANASEELKQAAYANSRNPDELAHRARNNIGW